MANDNYDNTATVAQIDATFNDLYGDYQDCKGEVWSALMKLTRWGDSQVGRSTFETVQRKYEATDPDEPNDGISAFAWMKGRFDSKESFAKQADLHKQLSHDNLVEQLTAVTGPESASDALNHILSSVWLRIRENRADKPIDFLRRILLAMQEIGGTVGLLAFNHIVDLDKRLAEAGGLSKAGKDLDLEDIPNMPEVYSYADLFIEALQRSWPEKPGGRKTECVHGCHSGERCAC